VEPSEGARAPKKAPRATLDIIATPWGHIWLDGRYMGRDRASVRVRAGSHTVGVGTDREAGPTQRQRVRAVAGKSQDVSIRLK